MSSLVTSSPMKSARFEPYRTTVIAIEHSFMLAEMEMYILPSHRRNVAHNSFRTPDGIGFAVLGDHELAVIKDVAYNIAD